MRLLAGRERVLLFRSKKIKSHSLTRKSQIRAMWYFTMATLRDEDTQRKGVVLVMLGAFVHAQVFQCAYRALHERGQMEDASEDALTKLLNASILQRNHCTLYTTYLLGILLRNPFNYWLFCSCFFETTASAAGGYTDHRHDIPRFRTTDRRT